MSEIVGHTMVPLDKIDIYVEGNMENISSFHLYQHLSNPYQGVERLYQCRLFA
jgi:hypothetical protein